MSMTSYHGGRLAVWGGDCLTLLASLPDNSVDSIVTDPPYGLGFMGKKWDDLPPGKEWAEACYRVLKPGGHILAFGGTRTWHRLAVAIEDGGFEIRDSLAWLYGSGFPKSMNVAKAIASGTGRPEDIRRLSMGEDYTPSGRGRKNYDHGGGSAMNGSTSDVDVPDHAAEWEGWGTALKPAFEPIVVGRKPLIGTVATNVLTHGTGALNINACRIETTENLGGGAYAAVGGRTESASLHGGSGMNVPGKTVGKDFVQPEGRWPANVILDESQAAALDEQSGTLTSGANPKRRGADGDRQAYGEFGGQEDANPKRGIDIGGASRFFYCAKAPKSERPVVELADGTKVAHPTVKPLAVMQWLVRLVTPPDGLVLDTFAGTGTTGEACVLEGFRCLMAEDPTKGEQDYLPLIDFRITRAVARLAETQPVQETVA